MVSVRINEDGAFNVMKKISGARIAEVLSFVEYQLQALFEDFCLRAE